VLIPAVYGYVIRSMGRTKGNLARLLLFGLAVWRKDIEEPYPMELVARVVPLVGSPPKRFPTLPQ
jgi:hypothetical protein